MLNEQQAQLKELLNLIDNSASPISVSSESGKIRQMEERIQRIRTEEKSDSRGSCQPGYSTWGN